MIKWNALEISVRDPF